MSLRFPSLSFGSVLVLARRLSVFGVATVNRKFQPNSKSSGLGAFPAAGHFPFAASGRGFWHLACATAFPANPSNNAIKDSKDQSTTPFRSRLEQLGGRKLEARSDCFRSWKRLGGITNSLPFRNSLSSIF